MTKDQQIILNPSVKDQVAVVCKTSTAKLSLKQKMIMKLRTNQPHKNQRAKQLKCWRQKFRSFIKSKQRHYLQNYGGSTCEFSCPICLQMLMTPCPTSCGHVFCFQCIDESIIRTGSCPTCRNYIRNEQFIESEPLSKLSHFFWITSSEKESYLEKYEKNQIWLKSRRIDKQNIKVNDLLDAKDTEHIWCKVKVLNIFSHNQKTDLLIHFEGWNEIYDEVININSQRLAPYNFFSQREDIPRYRLSSAEDNMRSRIQYGDFRDRLMQRGRNGPDAMRDVNINIQIRRSERRSLFHYLNLANLRPSINNQNNQTNSIDSPSIRSSQISESQLSEESQVQASQQPQQQNQVEQQSPDNDAVFGDEVQNQFYLGDDNDESIDEQNQNEGIEQVHQSSSQIQYNLSSLFEFRTQLNNAMRQLPPLRSLNSQVEQLPLVAPNFDILPDDNIEAQCSNPQQQNQQSSIEQFRYPSNVVNAEIQLGQMLNSSNQANGNNNSEMQNRREQNLDTQVQDSHQINQSLAIDDDQTRHKVGENMKVKNNKQKNLVENPQNLQGANLSRVPLTLQKFPSSFSISKQRQQQKQKEGSE